MGLALAVQDSRQRHRPRCAEQKGFGRWSLAACGCRQKPDSPKAATGERCSPCMGVLRPLRDTAVRATTQAATGHNDGACFTCPFLQRDRKVLLEASTCSAVQQPASMQAVTSLQQQLLPNPALCMLLQDSPVQMASETCSLPALLLYIPAAGQEMCLPARWRKHAVFSSHCSPTPQHGLCTRVVHHPSGGAPSLDIQLTSKLWVLLQQRHQGVHILMSVLQAVAVLSNLNQSLGIGCADL